MARINVDVDGTVCGFMPALMERLSQEGHETLGLDHPMWRTWDVFDEMSPEMKEDAFYILEDSVFWLMLPVIEYADTAIARLREAGHRIHWITSPWLKCHGWADARRDWLDRHFSHPDQHLAVDLTVTGDKSRVWADVFIDDKASSIIEWHRFHPAPKHRAILYRTTFNCAHHDDLENLVWTPESVDSILEWLEEKYA